MLPPRDPLQIKRHTQTEHKGMEKIFHANGNKKAGVVIFTSDKIDYNTGCKKNKEGHSNGKGIDSTKGYNSL